MTIDFDIRPTITQLQRVGIRPADKLLHKIMQYGPAAFEPLCELACNIDMLFEEPPACYAPIHALRLLGELRTPRSIEPLINALSGDILDSEDGTPEAVWANDAPQILGMIGRPAVDPLQALADDPERDMVQRGMALLALAFTIGIEPDLRPTVIGGLIERLAASDDREFNSHIVIALSNVAAREAYSQVMARFRAGAIDTDMITAAIARQMLYSSTRLGCVRHTLAERYASHGPFEQSR
ncbi:MAG TPA: HEAT repeat domain-containing protein [Roseiflexaceae bacterium]|nr:HEAT repeat domain-containing protein [Roseiflexaceae bacterium]HMP43272.1 HEAT repeat domain-containing protein [Roseiflexaceae bacterium]